MADNHHNNVKDITKCSSSFGLVIAMFYWGFCSYYFTLKVKNAMHIQNIQFDLIFLSCYIIAAIHCVLASKPCYINFLTCKYLCRVICIAVKEVQVDYRHNYLAQKTMDKVKPSPCLSFFAVIMSVVNTHQLAQLASLRMRVDYLQMQPYAKLQYTLRIM